MSPWRILLISVVCLQQVCGREEFITGYLDQSVVLKSGADTSWNLTKVQWSIYKNTTYIAGIKDGDVTLYTFWTHLGRLELDNRTGDLTIKNLTMKDSMIYTVALVTSNDVREKTQVHLSVREPLKGPQIQKMFDSLKDGKCHVALNCTASSQNVNLSWTPDDKFIRSYTSGDAVDSSLVLFTSFSGNRNLTFTCTASNGQQTETKQITVGCSEEKKCEVCTCSPCGSCTSSVVWAIVLTAMFTLAVAYAFTHRDKIIAALPNTLQNFFRNICGSSPDSGGGEEKKCDKKTDKNTSFV
ncbi:hypothetical protein PO909_024755 [Leuciscus waleckii]